MSLSLHGQRKLDAYYNYGIFKNQNEEIYIENYLRILPKTYFIKNNGQGERSGRVSVHFTYSSGSSIVFEDKVILSTGELLATDTNSYSLPGIFRHPLKEGNYKLQIYLEDLHADGINTLTHSDSIFVHFNKNKPQMSFPFFTSEVKAEEQGSIFNKSGLFMLPYEGITWHNQSEFMTFYQEIYGASTYIKDSIYLLHYYLQDLSNDQVISETEQSKILPLQSFNASINYLPIKDLKPGFYFFVAEVRDINQNVYTQSKMYVQIVGKEPEFNLSDIESVGTEWLTYVNNRDTLEEYIRSLAPISNRNEINLAQSILKSENSDALKKYIVSYWYRKSGEDRLQAFKDYRFKVGFVNTYFSTPIRRGYQTDRGRVYLQYGPPDVRSERPNEPHAYPYEIWWYYKLKTQSNRKFVFYTTESATNDYELLHSDAIGERRTPNWEFILNGRGKKDSDIDNNSYQQNYGSWGNDLWRTPR